MLLLACGSTTTERAPAPTEKPAADYVPIAAVRPPPEVESILPATEYLSDDYADRFERRGRIARWGPLRLSLDGDDLAHGGSGGPDNILWEERVVIVDRGERVRIVDETRVRRLLLWVERADMARLPAAPTILDVDPNEPPFDGMGVTVLPGAPVTFGAQLREFVHVTYGDTSFDAAGWISLSALDEVYTPEPVEEPALEHVIVRAVQLLDGPGGRALGAFNLGLGDPRVEVLGNRDGYREVAYYGDGFFARGFVESDAVKHIGPSRMGTMGMGGGGGFGISDRIRVTLHAGTCLFDTDGDIVGVILEETTSYGGRDDTGTWYAAVGSDWGIFDIRLQLPEGVEPTGEVPTAWGTCD